MDDDRSRSMYEDLGFGRIVLGGFSVITNSIVAERKNVVLLSIPTKTNYPTSISSHAFD